MYHTRKCVTKERKTSDMSNRILRSYFFVIFVQVTEIKIRTYVLNVLANWNVNILTATLSTH